MKVENLDTPGKIRTFSGHYVDIFRPDHSTLIIEDIAHSLSMQPRFGGHLPKFLSVAQHSIFVANLVSSNNQKLSALMHDASEAYLMDIPTPVKRRLDNYEEIEYNLMMELSKVFKFDYPLSKEIKEADRRCLEWEWDTCMLGNTFSEHHKPVYWSHEQAKFNFLKMYNDLEF